MNRIASELDGGQEEYLNSVMWSNGYGLWDVTDHHIIWFDKKDNEDEVLHLLAFKSWTSAYEYAVKIPDHKEI